MPIVIDAEARRRRVAEAAWRIVADEGFSAASVRRIAVESNLSTGSVRHFFPTQAALHAFAMETVTERIQARVAALDLPRDPIAAAELALGQLLPLDDERRLENRVWLAFGAAALTDPALGEIRRRAYDDLRSVADHWVRRLRPDAAPSEQDVEAERLFALLDGMAMHAATRPERLDPAAILRVLDRHLRALVAG